MGDGRWKDKGKLSSAASAAKEVSEKSDSAFLEPVVAAGRSPSGRWSKRGAAAAPLEEKQIPGPDPLKQRRALEKKMRQIETLENRAENVTLNAEEERKLASKTEVAKALKELDSSLA